MAFNPRSLDLRDHRHQPAGTGVGPLIQRDYWAVLKDCSSRPSEVIQKLRGCFCELADRSLVIFDRAEDRADVLQEGERLHVKIRMTEPTAVEVLRIEPCSITLGTLEKHPEAGRITFGAYRNDRGDVVFHIRSRARSSSKVRLLGFLTAGDPMQTNTWTDFVDSFAHTVANGVVGSIQVEEQTVEPGREDEELRAPTFIAEGD